MAASKFVQVGLPVLGLLGVGLVGVLLFRGGGGGFAKQAYYYDESSGRLYTSDAEQPVPMRGPDGGETDGVMAIVYICSGGDCGSDGDRRIAYLAKYTDEYNQLMASALEALDSGGTLPEAWADRGLRGRSTLVRGVDETEWVPLLSPHGDDLTAWKVRSNPDCRSPLQCDPSN